MINTIEYAFVLCPGGKIEKHHLPDSIRQDAGLTMQESRYQPRDVNGPSEKQQLIDALQATGGNKTKAAAMLGVSRVTVWSRMKKHGLEMGVKSPGHEGE